MGRYLIAGISLLLALFVTKNFLVWAALAACLVIFAFPCVLLGMRVLDELIGDELNYYKDELRTGGLPALIGN